ERSANMQPHRRPHYWMPLLLAAAAALLASVDSGPAAEQVLPPATTCPPIPVRFRLDEPAFVTLVIERTAAIQPDGAREEPDKAGAKLHYTGRHGLRVKNLVSNTWFAAGEHTVWWDGLDESNVQLYRGASSFSRVPWGYPFLCLRPP